MEDASSTSISKLTTQMHARSRSVLDLQGNDESKNASNGHVVVFQDSADDSDPEAEGLLEKGPPLNPAAARASTEATTVPTGGRIERALSVWLRHMTAKERKDFISEMMIETLPVQMVVVIGAILTGMLLDRLQNWTVFIRVEELFILVPILLNLKGNLEMNLAARFSTSANMGELDLRRTRDALVRGNMALLQVQALIVSFIAGLIAFALGMASRNGIEHSLQHPVFKPGSPEAANAALLRGSYFEAAMLLCVSMLAASLSCLVLGSFMCATVIIARRNRINPDNVSTPLAAALGDLLTLVIMGLLSAVFIKVIGTFVSTIVIALLLFAIGLNVMFVLRNVYVQELLSIGWAPLFIAMAVSSGTGIILEHFVNQFRGFGLTSTAFTAISGSAGTVYAARMSTSLHSGKREHYKTTAAALSIITLSTLACLVGFVWITNQADVSLVFVGSFFASGIVQILFTLTFSHTIVNWLWKRDYDPDAYAIPLMTATTDVSGQLLLAGTFALARWTSGSSSSEDLVSTATRSFTKFLRP